MYGGLHSPAPLPTALALVELAREFTPRVEALGPTPVLLDLQGLGRAWPSPRALGEALLEAARGRRLEARVAVAASRVAALLVSQAREGLTVVAPGEEAGALAPLPLSLLALDPEREETLRRWGLRTLGDLAALPAAGLAERLGPDAPRLRRLARGEDDAPLVTTPAPASFACTLDLEWPVDGLEPLSFLLARVLEPLCAGLVQRGRRAAALTLELGLVDGSVHRRDLHPAAPSAEPRTWRTLLLLDLETHPPRDAIQVLALRAEPTPARTVQFSLLDPAQPSPERLAETMARLHEWTSDGRGGAAVLLDTHRPGAFVMGSFAPGAFAGGSGGGAVRHPPAQRASADSFRASERPRPPPAPPRIALRVFRPPRPAQVSVQEGRPVFVSARSVRGAVLDLAGPWRASGDWWDVAWSREEWDVALAAGVYRIFRDRLREAWFLEGELD
jgi:protein ImuB